MVVSSGTAAAPPQDVKPQAAKSEQLNKYPFWAPRFWHGMTASAWFGMLARNRFSVSISRLPMVLAISAVSVCNSLMRMEQALRFGGRIRRTEMPDDPIFIIGHWRSGTTHLHELVVLDEQFTSPTTYECFVPHHFLVSAWWITKLKFLLPAQRPMDNMHMGWHRPQEDEFALTNMGAGSPYETMAFPNHRPVRHEFLDLESITSEQRQHWKQCLFWFLTRVTLRSARQAKSRTPDGRYVGKQLVLKSPPHTARIKVLLELFPKARFIHIVRDPYSLFASNVRLWRALWEVQGCQKPQLDAGPGRISVEEYVFQTFQQMYRNFDADKALIPAGQFCEVRYENLVRSPVEEVRQIYETLGLSGFEDVRPKLEEYLEGLKDYQPNRHSLPAATQAAIAQHWGDFIQKYGYTPTAVS